MKKKFTSGRVLIASFLILIFCILMPNKNGNEPYVLVAFLGLFSILAIPVSFILWVIKAVKTRNNPQQQNTQPIETNPAEKTSFFAKINQKLEEHRQQKALERAERLRIIEEEKYKEQNFESMNYKMIDGVAVIWEGETKPASFRIYDNKQRLEGIITKLTLNKDGRFYITLTDPEKGTKIVTDERELETMILIGSTRYEFTDLCRKVLKIDLSEMFGFANFVRDELYKPRLMLLFEPPQQVTFSHRTSGETIRDLFTVREYYKSNSNEEYLKVNITSSNKELMIPVNKITTMIQLEDGKKIKLDEWLKNICKAKESN
jgi:hypothetical protein